MTGLVLIVGGGVLVAGLCRVWLRRGWGVAIGAGLAAMLLAGLLTDYLWYPLQSARLSDSRVIAQTTQEAAPLRPWTLIAPAVVRFVAVETDAIRPHGIVPEQRIVPLIFVGRHEPELTVDVLFDCLRLRSFAITDASRFADNGTVIAPDWQNIDQDDPILIAACAPPL